nr:increased DNA methylation 1 isoform X1 [Ipomoea batatas]
MLFPEEIYNLRDDGFEGSSNEHQIFTEVFFENSERKKKCHVAGLLNSESDDSKETTPSCFPGSGNSAFVVQKDSYCKIEEISGVKKLGEKRLMPSMDIINGPAPKYRKVSGNEKDMLASDSKARFSEINRKGPCGKSGSKKLKKYCLEDDDLLISAFIKKPASKSANNRPSGKPKPLRKQKSKKDGKNFVEGEWPSVALRNVLSWMIHFGVVCIGEVIQYRNLKDDSVVKAGVITRNGILCHCCGEEQSITKFKRHAGFKLKNSCLNLFLESGKPLMLCQLEAWSAEYKAKKAGLQTVQFDETDQNDDSCGHCGGGGQLICCDNCPSTFHQACLYAQEIPDGSWYCPRCTCQICKDVVKASESSSSSSAMKCMQCEHQYHNACLKHKGFKRGVASEIWLCGERCEKVYSGLSSLIGEVHLLPDGFSWALLRCNPYDQKIHPGQRYVALNAECNSKLAVALTIMEECFLPMVDPKTGIDMMAQVIYNWGSQFPRLNYYGFYTVVLEQDDVLVSVASIRIHRATVAEMPLIATCSKYRRQGLCRRLMDCIEKMLKSFKVETLVISAIPSLVKMWTQGFGFSPLEDEEKRSMSNDNLMVFPGTVWLKKPLYEALEADQPTGSKEVDVAIVGDHCKLNLSPHCSSAGTETRDPDREEMQLDNEGGICLHSRCSICSTEVSVGNQASLLEGH